LARRSSRAAFLAASAGLAGLSIAAAPLEGEVAILEGDDAIVSRESSLFEIRFDAERNDLAAIVKRYVRDVSDAGGVLVLFTTFDDRGPGGPAYFVPIHNETAGTGVPALDVRADYGTLRFEGVVDMKLLASHPPDLLSRRLAHEIAHRHLAHLSALRATSTIAIDLAGRQHAHWRAALETDASLMGGYAWQETTPGHFLVTGSYRRFSPLDLYGLGLAPKEAVSPFFSIDSLRTEDGFALPADADLPLDARALGTRIDLTIDDVIRAEGPRVPATEPAMHAVFALVTKPGEAATSTGATRVARTIDGLRSTFAADWRDLTRGRGALCTTIAPCPEDPADAGAADAVASDLGSADASVAPSRGGCTCRDGGSRPRAVELFPLLSILALLALRRARL
jgi:hypothetical protein